MAKNSATAPPGYTTVSIYDQAYHLTGQNPAHIHRARRAGRRQDARRRCAGPHRRLLARRRSGGAQSRRRARQRAGGTEVREGHCTRAHPARHARRSPRGRTQDRLVKRRTASPKGAHFDRPDFDIAFPKHKGPRPYHTLVTPHKTCNSSQLLLLSAIETGLQSRWVVNAG